MNNRRDFIKKCGLSTAPLLVPSLSPLDNSLTNEKDHQGRSVVNFIYDGLAFTPQEYIKKLSEIDNNSLIERDFYGNGGTTKALEEKFADITGKEKAIYLPTGTMANQLAIKLLNGQNTKVIVPENSHVFRDEADAAQSVHNKRLIPVDSGQHFFTATDLEYIIKHLSQNEVFKSGLGTVVVEHPIRRADGRSVPLPALKELSNYCKKNNLKLHLDGARIHIACAYNNVTLQEYSSHFDTVYISLYKYLNAGGGAMLCGDASIIDQISHQIKIYGGTVYQTWNHTAMALHYLEGIEKRWKLVVTSSDALIRALNKIEGVSITKLKNGTNIHHLRLAEYINLKKLANTLYSEHNIWIGRADGEGIIKFTVNESILSRSTSDIVNAWAQGIKIATE